MISVHGENGANTSKGGKNGMNGRKSGSSPKGSSTEIPSSAFFILCCILNL
jgi:hypothetical protein